KLRPLYLVVGEERLLVDEATRALRDAAAKGGIAGFNEDKFTAGEASVDAIVSAARMLPMMAPLRFVLVRGLERWEKKDDDDDGPRGKKGVVTSPLDALAEYAKAPVDSTVMVLVATKLHGQRRLVTTAKKAGFLVTCDPLNRRDLPGWIRARAREKGHAIDEHVADLLAEIAGPELGYVDDALERLSLYVGAGQPIGDDAVAAVVTPVRQSTVWELLDALGKRRLDLALGALGDVLDPKDGGLRLLGTIGWSVRQMVRFESALRGGASPGEAASRAGVPPFRANDLARTVQKVPAGTLASWLTLMAEADLALKGSKRPPEAVLATMLIAMCRG
ncbi:MAG TPA: DNA polymerase III subunit delta, partial [Minicystis sp.]|nr:DNA polymerase III subunit delta [Minicystis sp.]